jgi:hypothetical protein
MQKKSMGNRSSLASRGSRPVRLGPWGGGSQKGENRGRGEEGGRGVRRRFSAPQGMSSRKRMEERQTAERVQGDVKPSTCSPRQRKGAFRGE